MVDVELEHVLARVQLQQHGAHDGARGQVERAHRVLGDAPPCLLPALLGREGAQVDDGQGQRRGLGDALDGAFGVRVERGAQGLVPAHERGEALAQGVDVELTGQLQHDRHVVGRAAGLQLVQEPQALLGEGEGQLLRARHALDGWGHARLSGAHGRVDALGEGGDGGRLEQVAQGEVHVEGRADAGDGPRGEQRVAAQLEEVVGGTDARHAEHLGEDAREQLLGGSARGDVRRGGRQQGGVGGGQGLAVHLGVGGEGQRVQPHEGGGHHVLGQPLLEGGAQGGHVERLGSGDVADEALVAGHVLAHQGHGLRDVREGEQGGFDFGELDAVAAHLDLRIRAAEELQHAVTPPAGEVARAVQAGTRDAGEGVGDETLGGEGGLLHIAPGHAVAADEQLTHDADRHGLTEGLQQVHLRIADGTANGHGRADVLHRSHPVGGGEERALGRAVAGGDGDAQLFEDAAHVRRAHHVTTGEQLLHPTKRGEVVVHHLGEEAGGEVQRRHAVLRQHRLQFLQVGGRVGREDDEPRAMEQRAPQLQGGRIERNRRDEEERLIRAEVRVVVAEDGAQHGGLRSADALGPTGGTRGEVDVREALR